MTTFNIATPDQDASAAMQVKLRSFSFGDGYTQDIADGLNAVSGVYTLNFTNRTQATVQAMDDFFTNQAGAPFTWVNPRGQTIKVKCLQWIPSYIVSTACSMSATFTQSFEP